MGAEHDGTRQGPDRVPTDRSRPARAGARSLTSRISTGHVVMILAGLLGLILTLGALRDAGAQTAVLVAATDLVPGTVIDDDSVRVARVDASGEVLATLVPEDSVARVDGMVTTHAVAAGAPLTRNALADAGEGAAGRSMSFPLPRARALGGALEPGDRVDVLGVAQGGSESAYVMTDAEVLAIDGARSGPLGTSDELTVTLAVEADGALQLATALEVGAVTLVRSTGARAVDVGAPSTGSATGATGP